MTRRSLSNACRHTHEATTEVQSWTESTSSPGSTTYKHMQATTTDMITKDAVTE